MAKKDKAKSTLKTSGGYQITDFKIMDKPIDRGILFPMLYSAIVHFPFGEAAEVFYTKEGKCSNYTRSDAFIDIELFLNSIK